MNCTELITAFELENNKFRYGKKLVTRASGACGYQQPVTVRRVSSGACRHPQPFTVRRVSPQHQREPISVISNEIWLSDDESIGHLLTGPASIFRTLMRGRTDSAGNDRGPNDDIPSQLTPPLTTDQTMTSLAS